jgi:crossover junction endodeoxyribonuclease RuvC
VIVLGLDPGSRHFGWGVVARDVKSATRLAHVAHGVIDTDPKGTFAERLVRIERELVEVIRAHAPAAVGVESLFFAKDAQAAAKLGHARGVALLVCARAGLPIAEYPPARVKLTVAGGGRAEKTQVAHMVRVLLGLAAVPLADAADALAVAVTHLQASSVLAALSGPVRPPRPRAVGGARGRFHIR